MGSKTSDAFSRAGTRIKESASSLKVSIIIIHTCINTNVKEYSRQLLLFWEGGREGGRGSELWELSCIRTYYNWEVSLLMFSSSCSLCSSYIICFSFMFLTLQERVWTSSDQEATPTDKEAVVPDEPTS